MIRIALGEEELRRLVRGEVARVAGVVDGKEQMCEVILSDIGWDRILAAVDDAILARGHGP